MNDNTETRTDDIAVQTQTVNHSLVALTKALGALDAHLHLVDERIDDLHERIDELEADDTGDTGDIEPPAFANPPEERPTVAQLTNDLEDEHPDGAPEATLLDQLSQQPHINDCEEALHRADRCGEIYAPKDGFWRRT